MRRDSRALSLWAMRRRFFRRVRSAIAFPASGSPALDERERGGQIREGYGRLQAPGTTPDVLVAALPGLRQYTTHQAQSFGSGRATFVLRGFGAFPAPRDSRARGRRKFMTAPVKERRTRRNYARFGQIYFAVFIPVASRRAIRSARSDPFTQHAQLRLFHTRQVIHATRTAQPILARFSAPVRDIYSAPAPPAHRGTAHA